MPLQYAELQREAYYMTSEILASPLPAAHSVNTAAAMAGVGRTTIFAALKSGALKARKIGRRTVILDEELRRWLSSLPPARAA
jgi:excisionase family DNA binding protein